jgi:hypothetical protein
MPIKKIPNKLNTNYRRNDAVISVFTDSKKGHFNCSESRLFEHLESAIFDPHKYYQVHLTTHPSIAVHITGDKDKIDANESKLRLAIEQTLSELHDIGNVKIL